VAKASWHPHPRTVARTTCGMRSLPRSTAFNVTRHQSHAGGQCLGASIRFSKVEATERSLRQNSDCCCCIAVFPSEQTILPGARDTSVNIEVPKVETLSVSRRVFAGLRSSGGSRTSARLTRILALA
jgi:hypothetical protein